MLNDKDYSKYMQYEIDKIQLQRIEEERDQLMQRINDLDRIEVNVIKMMDKGEVKQ